MNLLFLQPAAAWALIALPLIVGIHLLRRRAKVIRTSTLFLLEKTAAPPAGGRRLAPLKNSLPLWLQLLAASLLALALMQPILRTQGTGGTRVIVLDDTASMSAFREPALAALERVGKEDPDASEWILLDTSRRRIWSGTRFAELVASARREWVPRSGAQDPSASLRLAGQLAQDAGRVVFITDHPPVGNPAERWIAVGRPLQNVGFSGLRVDPSTREWSALLQNYGDEAIRTAWTVAAAGRTEEPRAVDVSAGEGLMLNGVFPPGVDQMEVRLTGDAFALDDIIFLRVPAAKLLRVRLPPEESSSPLGARLIRALGDSVLPTGTDADLEISVYDGLNPVLPVGPAVVFVTDLGAPQRLATGEIVAEEDPLVEGLDWSGLIRRECLTVPAAPGDRVLVWQNGKPLLFVRQGTGGEMLIWNLDLAKSNAIRLPAFAVVLYRFADRIRARLVRSEVRLVEVGQVLDVAGTPPSRAPHEAGFFSVKGADGEVLLSAAANFADAREADFRKAGEFDRTVENGESDRPRPADTDLRAWLIVALLALLLGNWAAMARESPAFAGGKSPVPVDK